MGLGNMIMLGVAGLAIAAIDIPGRRRRPALRFFLWAAISLLIALPIAFLIESAFDIALGIDLPAPGVLPTAMIPHPGRTSPNGALALLFTGVALWSVLMPGRRLRANIGFLATLMTGAIGLAALIGHALGLQDLYRFAGFNRLLPVTAGSMGLCAVGLWSLVEPASTLRRAGDAERQINRRGAGLFALVALISGVAGFAVLRTSFEEATAKNLLLTTRTTANAIASEIEATVWYPKVIAARASVRRAMAELGVGEPTAAQRADANGALAQLAERYFNEQVTGAQFLAPDGAVLYSTGTLSVGSASVRHVLQDAAGGAVLFWANGYVLETRNDIVDHGRLAGVLVVETRLPRIDELLGEVQEAGPTTDAALCSAAAAAADGKAMLVCAPTRFYPAGLSQPMQADRATVAGTLALALEGASGTRLVRDPSAAGGIGANVISAYVPVKQLGLALGVRSEVESLYASLRERVLELALVLAAVVVAGTLILRGQLRPLVAALAREQRRSARILENSNDAFVALDAAGLVTDWNSQAVRLFGWSAREALGQPLARLIVAPAAAAALDTATIGNGAEVLRHRLELQGRRRDGSAIPVELAITRAAGDDGWQTHVFIQDISARQAAREALHHSEQRLRLIANNLPALVSYIDRDFRYRFTNNQYQRWFDLPEQVLIGRSVAEVFGATVFESIRPRLEAALAGTDVTFEHSNQVGGAASDMLVHYIPDRDQHGRVIGVFGMVLDQTPQRLAQARLAASERQLRAVTDNLPALISYIDADEKLQFLNGTFRDWLGIDLERALGQPLATVLGADMYEQRRAPLQLALAGQRQEFDIETRTGAGRRHLHTVYIPDERDDGSTCGVFTVSMDVTRLKLIEEELRSLSSLDTLTGLPNRRQLGDRLALALARHQRDQAPLALMFLDIDKFKAINDTLGHAVGDAVLQTFASRVARTIREADTVARLGGDEFIVVIEGLGGALDAAQVAEKILAAVRLPFMVENQRLDITTSIGIAVSLGRGAHCDQQGALLMETADRALYRAKQAGRDDYQLEALPAG